MGHRYDLRALGLVLLAAALPQCGGGKPADRSRSLPALRAGCAQATAAAWCTKRKLPAVVQIAIGPDQALCLRLEDGAVACSGARGMADGQPLPGRDAWTSVRRVGGVERAVDVAVGTAGLACAVGNEGALFCWGDPRLYAEQAVTAPSPRQVGRVTSAADVVQIVLSSTRGQSLVRKRDGSVWHWRWDDPGARFGVGASTDLERFEGIESAAALAITSRAGCIRKGKEVHCWGQLTDGAGAGVDLGADEAPRRIEGLPEAARLSLSEQDLCVATPAGAVHCVRVESEALAVREVAGLTGVVELAAGARHSCALTRGGEVHCWGDNRLAQLGDGKPDSAGPVRVARLTAASCIAAHGNRTCACVADAAPYCWGGAPGKSAAPAF